MKKEIFLTFDDGPIPEVTPWVLDELKKAGAKATFFCIGENIEKHPEVFKRILAEGHSVGNHTFNHLNGWKTKTDAYLENVFECEKSLAEHNSKLLFRPPYGKITSKQSKSLQKKGYKIIMWDVLSYDFDNRISEEKCLNNVLKNMKSGSVVVFHDSLKAKKNLQYALPKVLKAISEKGFVCRAL